MKYLLCSDTYLATLVKCELVTFSLLEHYTRRLGYAVFLIAFSN